MNGLPLAAWFWRCIHGKVSHNRTWYFLRDHVAKIDVPSKNLKIYRCLFIIEACLALLLAPETQTMLLVLRLWRWHRTWYRFDDRIAPSGFSPNFRLSVTGTPKRRAVVMGEDGEIGGGRLVRWGIQPYVGTVVFGFLLIIPAMLCLLALCRDQKYTSAQ